MNERLKELAVEAEVWANQFEEHWADCPDTYQLFKEKFAELIVRECADFVSETATIETLLGDRLKEHFGVE